CQVQRAHPAVSTRASSAPAEKSGSPRRRGSRRAAGRVDALKFEKQPAWTSIELRHFDERRLAYKVKNGGHEVRLPVTTSTTRPGQRSRPAAAPWSTSGRCPEPRRGTRRE